MSEPSSARPLLAVTGAAGYVAGLITPALRQVFRLRRIDVVDHDGEADDEVLRADAADVGLMTDAFRGVDAVVHLAAKAFEDDFLTVLLPRNVVTTWSVFEACARAGVRRVVFTSTGQTIGGNPEGTVVSPDMPPRPISVYAATKVFGEALARYFADRGTFRVTCVRPGWVAPRDSPVFATESELPRVWCSSDDLARLIVAALAPDTTDTTDTTGVHYAIVHAFSGDAAERVDTSNPYGWQPQDWPAGHVSPSS